MQNGGAKEIRCASELFLRSAPVSNSRLDSSQLGIPPTSPPPVIVPNLIHLISPFLAFSRYFSLFLYFLLHLSHTLLFLLNPSSPHLSRLHLFYSFTLYHYLFPFIHKNPHHIPLLFSFFPLSIHLLFCLPNSNTLLLHHTCTMKIFNPSECFLRNVVCPSDTIFLKGISLSHLGATHLHQFRMSILSWHN
ncbi:hypothetical protein RJT34_16900 [Clitoria ternatea]|uniref:Uncharacterized protein n=1 Tax=Clitoria ternatea TaxID=43366 RepID=A0AAN9PE66_CLITE